MTEPQSRFYAAPDGLRLHCLDFTPSRDVGALPVVCLPGLTRGAGDFMRLGRALAFEADRPRRVVAFDYRGRGRSDHDADWRHYDIPTERADVLAGLARDGIERAHFIGTSRGGLHAMALAPTHRAMIASVILNDIGPVLEPAGLARIKGYIGVMAKPRDIEEAIALLKAGAGRHFVGLSPEEWRVFATTTFGDSNDDLRLRYDPQVARTLDALDLDKPLPDSWHLFDALNGLPVLTIRGEHSDLLSPQTLEMMAARWPGSETMVVAGQGHAPLLADAPSISRIAAFLASADEGRGALPGSVAE